MQKGQISKYRPYRRVDLKDRTWPDKVVEHAPIWASVDLRDGNQALAIPMTVDQKVELFEQLVKIGFKEIEVGFPSASETEFRFLRRLVEEKRIPDDVFVQVLVQAREHLIRRTFESLEGVPNAIVHLYNSTSPLQRKVTFNLDKDAVKQIAVKGTQLVKQLATEVRGTRLRFEYSPESFSDTETDYALEVCEAVMDVWQPSVADPIILNLPATVEVAPPNVHADQIEWFCRNLSQRDAAIVSLHTHNDRGTGAAATELGLMAGADRVEGTLFGSGERTGNLDIVTIALNLYAQGVDPRLDFSNIPALRAVCERITGMPVPARQPYAGDLVFTAFSGSHQDAIKKGMDRRRQLLAEGAEDLPWEVPYLLIDPEDIGCSYEAIIRINSQSGKGGVAYILQNDFGLDLPKAMHPEFGIQIGNEADKLGRELSPQEIYEHFRADYINLKEPLEMRSAKHREGDDEGTVGIRAEVIYQGKSLLLEGIGNGPISALVDALEQQGWKNFRLVDYRQHSIGGGSRTQAAAYIQLERADGSHYFGCGLDANIETAGLRALISAFNRAHRDSA